MSDLERLSDEDLLSLQGQINAILSDRQRARQRAFSLVLRERDPAEKTARMRALIEARSREAEERERNRPEFVYLTPRKASS